MGSRSRCDMCPTSCVSPGPTGAETQESGWGRWAINYIVKGGDENVNNYSRSWKESAALISGNVSYFKTLLCLSKFTCWPKKTLDICCKRTNELLFSIRDASAVSGFKWRKFSDIQLLTAEREITVIFWFSYLIQMCSVLSTTVHPDSISVSPWSLIMVWFGMGR